MFIVTINEKFKLTSIDWNPSDRAHGLNMVSNSYLEMKGEERKGKESKGKYIQKGRTKKWSTPTPKSVLCSQQKNPDPRPYQTLLWLTEPSIIWPAFPPLTLLYSLIFCSCQSGIFYFLNNTTFLLASEPYVPFYLENSLHLSD